MIPRRNYIAVSSVSSSAAETTGKLTQAAPTSDVNESVYPAPASLRDVSHVTPTIPALPDLLALYAAARQDSHRVPDSDLSKDDIVHVPL